VAERKLTDAQRAEAVQLHADGVSCRTLARMYGVSPTVVSRITRSAADAGMEDAEDEPAPPPVEYDRRPPEDAFGNPLAPDDDDIATVVTLPDLPPDRAPGQALESNLHPLDWAEHRLKTTRQDIAHLRSVSPSTVRGDYNTKLAQAGDIERTLVAFISRYADAYRGLSFGRPRTWIPVGSQTLHDGPPRALWDNPHDHGPRGFTVVGS
jgi:hypothetical protein